MAVKTIKGRLSRISRALTYMLKQRLRLIHLLIFCLAVLPACLHGITMLEYGVNVPYRDDWSRVWLFQEVAQGTLSFGDLLAQYHEHRLFFPNLVSVVLAFPTGFNVRYEMLVSVLLACLISFNVYRLVKLTIGGSPLKQLLIYFLLNLFIFAPIQVENWLRGIQFALFVPIACITTCLSVAYSGLKTRTKFLICMIISTISTFSLANGVLCWILVLPVLAWSRSWSDLIKKGWLISAWVVGFALNAALYFHDYQSSPSHPPLSEASVQLVQALRFFLALLGSSYVEGLPLVSSVPSPLNLATVLGAALLLLFASSCIYLLASRDYVLTNRAVGWMMIGAYSIVSALIITFGRLGFGAEYAIQQRYTTFLLYLAVSLISLAAIVLSNAARRGGNPLRSKPFATVFGSSLITIFVFLHLLTSVLAITNRMPAKLLERSNGKACLLLIDVVQNDECLYNSYWQVLPDADVLRGLATIANDMGFLTPGLIESDKVRDIEGAKSGSANYGSFDTLTRTDEGSYLASGWAISPEEGRPADAVLLTYEDADSEPTVFAVTNEKRIKRKDAAEALGSDSYLRSGWEETFSPNALPAGSTEIGAWAFDAEVGKAFELEGSHELEEPR